MGFRVTNNSGVNLLVHGDRFTLHRLEPGKSVIVSRIDEQDKYLIQKGLLTVVDLSAETKPVETPMETLKTTPKSEPSDSGTKKPVKKKKKKP